MSRGVPVAGKDEALEKIKELFQGESVEEEYLEFSPKLAQILSSPGGLNQAQAEVLGIERLNWRRQLAGTHISLSKFSRAMSAKWDVDRCRKVSRDLLAWKPKKKAVEITSPRKRSYAGRNHWLKANGYADYGAYLSSDLWLQIRARVYKEKGTTCAKCEKVPADQVHHCHYGERTMTGKSIKHLFPLCGPCHKAVHGLA